MSAPNKTHLVLPVVIPTQFQLQPIASLDEAKAACLKLAISSGVQAVVFSAEYYAEPTIDTQTVNALVSPIPDPPT